MVPTTPDKASILRAKIQELPQVEIETTHEFHHGVYQRGIFVPAGVVVAGGIHLNTSFLVLAKGRALVTTSKGSEVAVAPWANISPPGTRRILYAQEDCWFLAFVETPSTDVAEIESQTIVDSYQEFEEVLQLRSETNDILGRSGGGRSIHHRGEPDLRGTGPREYCCYAGPIGD